MESLHSTAILKKFEFLFPFSWPLRKLKKSSFALELNTKNCLPQPAMFCLSNSNVGNKITVGDPQLVRRLQKRNFGSWISLDFVVLVNCLGFK